LRYFQRINRPLQQGKPRKWTADCERALFSVKKLIESDMVLTHYDPEHPLKLACDPLSVGVEAVLFHVMEDGSERPIAFASHTLTKAERNYSQIVKEALAVTPSHHSLPWTHISISSRKLQ